MVRDRLRDLQSASDQQPHYNNGIMLQETNGSTSNSLFDSVDETRRMIERAANDVILIKQKHSMILASSTNDPRLQQELDEYVADFKRQSGQLRQRLRATEEALQAEERQSPGSGGAAMRIRKTQHAQLSRRFLEVIEDFNNSQMKFRAMCKDRMKRQLSIVGRNVDDEELDDMIESKNSRAFTAGIYADTAVTRQALDDVTARHADIKKLENNISELNEIFSDMSMLVGQQGDLVDRIDNNVSETAVYVETGVKQLTTAREHQSAARKKKVYCIIITVIIVLIIAGVIAIVLATQLGKH